MMADTASPLLLDARCVINLFASQRAAEILAALGQPVAVAAHVAYEEALYFYSGPPENVRQSKEQIRFDPLIQQGLVTVASLAGEREQEAFVRLAAALDDGEAMTAAIAIERGWSIATDDGRAINYLAAHYPAVEVVTTPALLRRWAEAGQPAAHEVRDTLEAVRLRANFSIGAKHSLYAWWQSWLIHEQS
jgi:predicted nucleic acid-binding protein